MVIRQSLSVGSVMRQADNTVSVAPLVSNVKTTDRVVRSTINLQNSRITMPSLDTVKAACQQALEDAKQRDDWQASYCRVVDPASVLELIAQIEATLGENPPAEQAAFVKLVRDLTGYIKLATGDKPDPVRDDLLLQAKELIVQAGH